MREDIPAWREKTGFCGGNGELLFGDCRDKETQICDDLSAPALVIGRGSYGWWWTGN
jgi:hypothetical protein